MKKYYVEWFDGNGGEVGSWSVLCNSDGDDCIVCDCPDVIGDGLSAKRSAEKIAAALNSQYANAQEIAHYRDVMRRVMGQDDLSPWEDA